MLLAPLLLVTSATPDTRDAALPTPTQVTSTPDHDVTATSYAMQEASTRAEPLARGASLRRLAPDPSDAPAQAAEEPAKGPPVEPVAAAEPAAPAATPKPPEPMPTIARPAPPAAPTAAAAVVATRVPAPVPPAPASASSAELRMLALINGSRAQGGLVPYALDAGVSAVARRHSGVEARLGYVYHDGQDGTAAARDGAACGSGWFGENVGAVWNGSVDALHWQYMAEPWIPINHRTNIMDANFKRVGIGAVPGASAMYMTMVFCR